MLRVFARSRACIALLLAIVSCQAAAQEFNPQGELTLAQAIDGALHSNPDLKASAYELRAAQARIVQAGLRPNPELQGEFENFAGTGSVSGTRALETTLSLSQVIELGGKRRLRVSAAESELGAATIEQRSAQLDLLAEVADRFIEVVIAQERLRFAGDAVRTQRESLDAIGRRVKAGRSPEAERSRARIALTRAQIEQAQAQSQLRAARFALSALWGADQPTFTTATAELFRLPPLQSFEMLAQRVDTSADILQFASRSRLREAELALARAQARPNLTLSVGVRRLEESDEGALVAGFSMPLPVSDRNQGAIREAQIRVEQNEALREAATLKLRASLGALYQELQASRVRVETLRSDAIPQAQLALDQTRSGYERGRFSFLELTSAQQDLLELQSAAIDAAGDYHRLLAQLERVTSAPLTAPLE